MVFKKLGRIICVMGGMILLSGLNVYALYGDRIYLHDGSSINGEIIESVPGVSFTLKRRDGAIHVFKMAEVWKVKFEEEEIYEDRLYLKDGSVIIGTIIGAIPAETYRIRTEDKSILVFRTEEVERVELKTPTPKVEVITPTPVTKIPSQPLIITPQPSPPQEKRLSIRPWSGMDWSSMDEVNDEIEALGESEKLMEAMLSQSFEEELGIVVEWEVEGTERTLAKRGVGFGGDLGRRINPNLELLGRIGYLSYPEIGLVFSGESNPFFYEDYGDLLYVDFDMDFNFKPSLIVLGGGIEFSYPIGTKLVLGTEGLLGYGLGRVKQKIEVSMEMYNLENELFGKGEYTSELDAKGGGLLLSLGGNLEYKVSPKFSLMGKAGYKRCKIEKMKYEDSWEEGGIKEGDELKIQVDTTPFDFSGVYLSAGLKFSF